MGDKQMTGTTMDDKQMAEILACWDLLKDAITEAVESMAEIFIATWEEIRGVVQGFFGFLATVFPEPHCRWCREPLFLDPLHGTCIRCGGPPLWWTPGPWILAPVGVVVSGTRRVV